MYCNWCGHKQITESNDVRIPSPRHKGNKWFSQVVVGDNRVYVSADSEEEYYAKARAAKTRQIEIKKSPAKMTLGEAIDRYIKDNDSVLSPSTINCYKSYRKTRFTAYMDKQTDSINFQSMVNAEAKIVSAKTVHNAWRLVTASLNNLSLSVPKINLPQKSKSIRPWLDYEQIVQFTDAIYGKPWEMGALLALHGLRRSEILHLSADDVDLDSGIIHVRGASVIGEGNKLTDKVTNKTKASTRDVHIVMPRLTELLRGKEGRLITTAPTTLYGLINSLCEKKGLPKVGVHGLRHSFASLAYHLNWSEATTMREGGWSNPQTVHNIYTHLANADANADIGRMSEFYADKMRTKAANAVVSTGIAADE
jgi:integrase